MSTKKEIAPIENRFIAVQNQNQIKEVIAALKEAVGAQLSWLDFPRIKTPSGGGLAWEIPSATDESEISKTLNGVILHTQSTRRYYKGDSEPDGSPPDCISTDGIIGIGDPGGECDECPFSQFGSKIRHGEAERGQACSAHRLLFLLQENAMLPVVVVIAPTGLKAIKEYMVGLALKATRIHQVVTRISLAQASNKDGIKYAQPRFSLVERIGRDNPATSVIEGYREMITGHSATVQEVSDIMENGDSAKGNGDSARAEQKSKKKAAA